MEPGCYLMKNSKDEIIYVGKAKKLKNRVNQYFVGAHDYKTTKLVSEIVDFDISYTFNIATNQLNATFNVECVPITNPIIIDSKNDTPDNEDSYKPLTRTYSMGDNNGLMTDFKALMNDIDRQNETLGKPEYVLEVDSSMVYYNDAEDGDTLYIPTPNDRLQFLFNNNF